MLLATSNRITKFIHEFHTTPIGGHLGVFWT